MKDILLNDRWDIAISPEADITLADSPMQEIMIRLQWFAGEWIFGPEYGLPYYEHMLVKNPNLMHVKNLIKNEILKVETVKAVENISIEADTRNRKATVSFEVRIGNELYRKEVEIHG